MSLLKYLIAQNRIFGLKKWTDKPFEEQPFAVPTTELRIYSSEMDSLDLNVRIELQYFEL
jgi:hypothetical protein